MKKTISINIAGVAYIIDEDAYQVVECYLEDVASRGGEIADDIEARMAEIFSDLGADHVRVVTLDMANRAIELIGSPDIFGERIYDLDQDSDIVSAVKRFTRNGADKIFGGVCSGLAVYLGADPSVVRVITFVLGFFTGIPIFIYILLWIVFPVKYYDENGKEIAKPLKNRR